MRPSPCQPIRVLAALAADDELSETEQRRLASHLATCDACRAFSDSVGGVTAEIRGAPLAPAPTVSLPLEARTAGRSRPRRRMSSPVLQVSAVAASIFTAVLVGRATIESPRPPASAPVIIIDSADSTADRDLARLAREYANDRARFGGDPPLSGAPGLLTD